MPEFNFELLDDLNLSACPYCGGTTGYRYTSVQRFSMTSTWNGEDSGGDFDDTERTTKPRCIDCNRYIKEQDL